MRTPHRFLQRLKAWWIQRFNLQRFFSGDAAQKSPILLTQRRVYILPTKAGTVFGLLLFILLLAAVNYANSLGYLLTFLLASVAIISILHTYKNLYNVKVAIGDSPPVFAGGKLTVPLTIENVSKDARFAIGIRNHDSQGIFCDVEANKKREIKLVQTVARRGWQMCDRITLETRFPLGLFRAWSYLNFDRHYLVYPQPETHFSQPPQQHYKEKMQGDQGIGVDDFAGLRSYRVGDSLKHIHWKVFAREQYPVVKQFGGDRSDELWLDWRSLPHIAMEQRLSRMTRWVLESEQQGIDYGLWLPDSVIAPAHGSQHKHNCLKALALTGLSS